MPDIKVNKAICDRIAMLFNSGGGSQEEVSGLLGIQRTQFGRIINGKLNPTLQQVCAISSHYEARTGWIIEGEEPIYKKEKSGNQKQPDLDLLTLMRKQANDLKSNFDKLFSQVPEPVSGTEDPNLLFPNEDLTEGKKKKAGKL